MVGSRRQLSFVPENPVTSRPIEDRSWTRSHPLVESLCGNSFICFGKTMVARKKSMVALQYCNVGKMVRLHCIGSSRLMSCSFGKVEGQSFVHLLYVSDGLSVLNNCSKLNSSWASSSPL